MFISILLSSCINSNWDSSLENSQKKSQNSNAFDSINISNLIFDLTKADKDLTPQLKYTNDGGSYYTYKKKPGENDLSLSEIRKRIRLGYKFYEDERQNITLLLAS